VKITVFGDMKPRNVVDRYQRFGDRMFSMRLVPMHHTTRCHVSEDSPHNYRRTNASCHDRRILTCNFTNVDRPTCNGNRLCVRFTVFVCFVVFGGLV
jgi:hypothetical protein